MNKKDAEVSAKDAVSRIFDDFESRQNMIGLYSLVLEIDRRINPGRYTEDSERQDHD